MLPTNSQKPLIISNEGGVQGFRDPVTGKEFFTTISKPIVVTNSNAGMAQLNCIFKSQVDLASQIASALEVIRAEIKVNASSLIDEARGTGRITLSDLRVWHAERLAEELRKRGFSAIVEMNPRVNQ